ncbi:adenylate/guanylate cyclase domain-containing protein [Sulfuricystis multivorans]|uniref:adenylate/guanylate cyclase domain-containing protein n=1 Tax=Sulfuricystis multivorans TaxID=2211108 RepID=UPI000F84392A|nr:adenylate/guanylate cyclase domain-containing protein [Sulfuricystis multivorans]
MRRIEAASGVKTLLARPPLLALSIALVAMGICFVSLKAGWADRLENFYLDAWHRLAGKRFEPSHAALVIIDDASLAKNADTPLIFWTPLFARAIDTLRVVKARVVVLDFIFSGSPETWLAKLGAGDTAAVRQYDRGFRSALNGGRIVLAGYLVGEGASTDDFILPSPDYLLSLPEQDVAAHVGLANLTLDADSVVRHFRSRLPIGDEMRQAGLPEATLAALAARQAGKTDLPGERRRIVFAGPPGSFPTISFATLLAPEAHKRPEIQALRDKVVIVGAGYAGMNDVHPTPYSNTFGAVDRMMPGPEIQANIVETLLAERHVRSLPATLAMLTVFFVAWGSVYVLLRYGFLPAGAVGLLWCLLVAWGAYRAFLDDWDIPAAQMQLSLVPALLLAGLAKFSRAEREKRHLSALFGRYVSPSVMQTLLEHPEMPGLGGQRREVTVLFSDIRDFTTLSERLEPEEVVELLNEYFERACAALLAEEATIDKFIGDAVMAEFGAPLVQADHAERALRAALKLLATAREFSHWVQARFPNRNLPHFAIGIGIHSGPAVIGNIGSSRRMEYTAVGDTVNTASRLEGMTKVVGCPILTSAATLAAITHPEAFHFGKRHRLSVKGKQAEIEVVELWPPKEEEAKR